MLLTLVISLTATILLNAGLYHVIIHAKNVQLRMMLTLVHHVEMVFIYQKIAAYQNVLVTLFKMMKLIRVTKNTQDLLMLNILVSLVETNKVIIIYKIGV